MEISFLNHKDLDHYCKLHEVLRSVLVWVYEYLSKSKTDCLIISSVFRHEADEKAKGRSGIHGLHRAIDIIPTSKPGGGTVDWVECARLATLINAIWYYGDGGKHHVAFADPHGTGPHIHLQVRNETHKRIIKENENVK